MNIIKVYSDHIEKKLDSGCSIYTKVMEGYIDVKIEKSLSLQIEYYNKINLRIKIHVLKNVELTLCECRKKGIHNAEYEYILDENSYIFLSKFYDASSVKENSKIYLNGEDAKIDTRFKTIVKDQETYTTTIYHNKCRTICNLYNYAVCLNGNCQFNINNIVFNKIKDCVISQNTRIITLGNSTGVVCPILKIDEESVEANHSAHIGTFSDDDIFYLESRGISRSKAINLLVSGILLQGEDIFYEKIQDQINKYWG